MERIFPISKQTCLPYVGKPVCAVLHDGTTYQGILESVQDGHLVINPQSQGPAAVKTYASKKKTAGNRSKGQASAFFPGFGVGSFLLPFTALALLFAIPFLGFPFFI